MRRLFRLRLVSCALLLSGSALAQGDPPPLPASPTPTAPVEPYPVEQRYVDEIDGERLTTYLDWLVLGFSITVTGCPAISIPCGVTADGLPVGLQLVGAPYGEAELLRTAAWCEAALGVSLRAPIDPRPGA